MLGLGHDYLLLHPLGELAKEDVLTSLLAVACHILEHILQVALAGAGIKVLCMTIEENSNGEMQNLMQLLELPFVSLLTRTVRNDLGN
jgi:hypothetical protein